MSDGEKVSSVENTPQELDRIRDIIFGSQMREYEQRFQTLQRDLERLQEELDHLNTQLSEQDRLHVEKLQDLRKESRKADDDLRDELRQTAQRLIEEKVDRVTLGELFVDLGTHLKSGGSVKTLLQDLGVPNLG